MTSVKVSSREPLLDADYGADGAADQESGLATRVPNDASYGSGDGCDEEEPNGGDVRLNYATATLAATIIGAGIMALPRAFATLGLLLGSLLLAFIFFLAIFSLAALIKSARSAGCWTYADLAKSQFGRAGAASLQAAILLNNSGSMIIYLIIIGDVLCGVAPNYSGLITNLVEIHDPESVVWVSRPFVMAVLCVFGLGPLISLRNLRLLAPMSSAAVIIAALFVISVAGLAVIAGFESRLGDFTWFPNEDVLGQSPWRIAINILAILPVITMSFVCHYNLLPVARNLQRFTERRILMVIRRALTICTILFTTVAGGGVLLFGTTTQDNILVNLTPEAVSKYISHAPAVSFCFFIRAGYSVCLMLSVLQNSNFSKVHVQSTFAMLNWALRETVSKTLFHVEMLDGLGFFVLSWSILAVEYLISILFPSVWVAMSLTGATAAVFVAYILPGALIIKVHGGTRVDKVLGFVCVVLGIVMGCVGVFDTLVPKKD